MVILEALVLMVHFIILNYLRYKVKTISMKSENILFYNMHNYQICNYGFYYYVF